MLLLLSSLPFSLFLKNYTQLYPEDLDHDSLLNSMSSARKQSVSLQITFSAH